MRPALHQHESPGEWQIPKLSYTNCVPSCDSKITSKYKVFRKCLKYRSGPNKVFLEGEWWENYWQSTR